jgi:hypothetical protein
MAEPSPSQEPEAAPAEAPDDFEAKQEKFGAAYAALAEGLKGEGIDRAVKVTRYLLAAFAAFVVLAAIVASL